MAKNDPELRSVPGRYVPCRAWGHAWDHTTVDRSGNDYIQGLKCLRCGTLREVYISVKTGFRDGNKYKYPEQLNPDAEPYQLPKGTGGALSMEERGLLTLSDIEDRYRRTVNEIEKARQRRKKA